uniref:PPPDE domain-containing protein n=1 Tax=Chromera velia CCMP2878 TaxID=1169474 RepID=A0A0G4HWF0_9ALVE|eukprot:Cvel_32625.t1-p1 / transcript=Cvel_32625.t1 / gene=Cvel_32625 / organism=Chromera_velia_CCMP2878 / gene_product=hypothetical protein / transcript_product=hypothetical protein / location=Cvel_scaffold5120:3379-4365(+) / protein_length=143 / sequence_SO=supercontig / SO=protein_coding / is_pseudo=false
MAAACHRPLIEAVARSPRFMPGVSYFVASWNGDHLNDFQRIVKDLAWQPRWHQPEYRKLYNNCWDFCRRAVCRGMAPQLYSNTVSREIPLWITGQPCLQVGDDHEFSVSLHGNDRSRPVWGICYGTCNFMKRGKLSSLLGEVG